MSAAEILASQTEGVLHYKLYSQNGEFIPMTCRDTPEMRRFVAWVRQHDRYVDGLENSARPALRFAKPVPAVSKDEAAE